MSGIWVVSYVPNARTDPDTDRAPVHHTWHQSPEAAETEATRLTTLGAVAIDWYCTHWDGTRKDTAA